ncbi:MAG TPA: helix-turn-helix domain-containing protein [Xanthobacteraceae bacterium]|nr:helix-turn-helix domain-containing protein [Xanthobacteraceae bacterium]
MMRVRLKADGRLVEVLADGTERAIARAVAGLAAPLAAPPIAPPTMVVQDAAGPRAGRGQASDAVYARGIRARAKLTQAEFAARIGVPIETVRNWEQGKRSPRGPARALLKVIDQAPQVAFAVLNSGKTER